MIERDRGGLSAPQLKTFKVSVHVKHKLKGRQKKSLGEKTKLTKDKPSLREQRMT